MSNYEEKIRQSSLGKDLPTIAESIFNQWLQSARQTFKKPEQWGVGLVNSTLIEEVLMQMAATINQWVNKTAEEQQQHEDGAYGYICRHMGKSLNVIWIGKYVLDDGAEYKNLLKLMSVRTFLAHDADAAKRLFTFHEFFISSFPSGVTLTQTKPDNLVNFSDAGKSDEVRQQEFAQELGQYLDDLIASRFWLLFNQHKELCCPDLTEYLPRAPLMQIFNKPQFNLV